MALDAECPICGFACKEVYAGWLRCGWCGWQGGIDRTPARAGRGRLLMDTKIRRLTITPASRPDQNAGLLAFVGCEYGDLHLDGLCLRRTRAGRLSVSFPARRDGAGRQHPYVEPRDPATRRAIEAAIVAAYRAQTGGAR